MELCAHYVVAMACEDGDDTSTLPVPESDCLIITTTQDPWKLCMELDRSDVVQVPGQGEQALLGLIVPDLDFMVITT